jgi:hypothetical protein
MHFALLLAAYVVLGLLLAIFVFWILRCDLMTGQWSAASGRLLPRRGLANPHRRHSSERKEGPEPKHIRLHESDSGYSAYGCPKNDTLRIIDEGTL